MNRIQKVNVVKAKNDVILCAATIDGAATLPRSALPSAKGMRWKAFTPTAISMACGRPDLPHKIQAEQVSSPARLFYIPPLPIRRAPLHSMSGCPLTGWQPSSIPVRPPALCGYLSLPQRQIPALQRLWHINNALVAGAPKPQGDIIQRLHKASVHQHIQQG